MSLEGKIIFASNKSKYLVLKTVKDTNNEYGFLTNIDNQNDSFLAILKNDGFEKVKDIFLKEHILSIIANEK